MWLVRSWPTPSPGFRLKVAEIHDVYMAVSGESMCEELHPCMVNMIYSNSCVRIKGLLGCLYNSYTSESGYSKMLKTSVSAMDGLLVGEAGMNP